MSPGTNLADKYVIKNIGILTWHYYDNFGSALQTFASFYTLKKLGYNVIILNYRNQDIERVNSSIIQYFKRYVKNFFTYFPFVPDRYRNNAYLFRKKYFKETHKFYNEDSGKRICSSIDAIVCGSDQIWAPNCYNPIYFANFLDGKKVRKISYAASIGLNDIPKELISKYKSHLEDFYLVSVREQEGKDLLYSKCGISSQVVLDPTLLVDANVYRSMQKKVRGLVQPYIFCYFLNTNHKYKEIVEEYANKHKLKIVGVSNNALDSNWMHKIKGIGSDQFLWLVDHAEIIFTDSYHGTIFSLLFHKLFWFFERFNENDPICQNSRMRQLQEHFNINNCLISDKSSINNRNLFDFGLFENQLRKKRKESLDFIGKSLSVC